MWDPAGQKDFLLVPFFSPTSTTTTTKAFSWAIVEARRALNSKLPILWKGWSDEFEHRDSSFEPKPRCESGISSNAWILSLLADFKKKCALKCCWVN